MTLPADIKKNSVHLVLFPEYDESLIDKALEERMGMLKKFLLQ